MSAIGSVRDIATSLKNSLSLTSKTLELQGGRLSGDLLGAFTDSAKQLAAATKGTPQFVEAAAVRHAIDGLAHAQIANTGHVPVAIAIATEGAENLLFTQRSNPVEATAHSLGRSLGVVTGSLDLHGGQLSGDLLTALSESAQMLVAATKGTSQHVEAVAVQSALDGVRHANLTGNGHLLDSVNLAWLGVINLAGT